MLAKSPASIPYTVSVKVNKYSSVREDVVGDGLLVHEALGDMVSIVTSPLSTAIPGPVVLVDELATEPA